MIQGVITRMASNSFALKGWAVTLVAGIFALSAKGADWRYFLIAFVPVLVFWGLDSYYLRQERLFRALYDRVRQPEQYPNYFPFSMDTSIIYKTTKTSFLERIKEIKTTLKGIIQKCRNDKYYWGNCFLSPTEFWFYFPLAALCLAIIIIVYCTRTKTIDLLVAQTIYRIQLVCEYQ